MHMDHTIDSVGTTYAAVTQEIAKVVVGQHELIMHIYLCLLCRGHALIEGVPGLGKTLLVKSIASVCDLSFSRIQFTPDLMPADILGTNIVKDDSKGNRYFEFYKGPIFSNIVLADEINRASPKTQSALLEAMQEEKVTIFGTTYTLTSPFIVLATQNPLEMEGTYPLPEAQIDRFFFKLKTVFPTNEELHQIIDKTTQNYAPQIQTVLDGMSLGELAALIREVPIATHVKEYAIALARAAHPNHSSAPETVKRFVHIGPSPRGIQSMVLAAKAHALMDKRYNVAIEDIRAVAHPSLRHRIILNLRAQAEGIQSDQLIDELMSRG